MTDTTEALRELLARSKSIADELDEVSLERATILELCAALAQRQQVPEFKGVPAWKIRERVATTGQTAAEALRDLCAEGRAALTAAPSAQAEPHCTRSHPHEDMSAACEALTIKARADNKAAQAEPVKWQARLKDEPGAEWWDCSAEWARLIVEGKGSFALLEARALYAAPPTAQAEPQVTLTDEQIEQVWEQVLSEHDDALPHFFARAIVAAARGIGKQECK